MSFSFFPSNTAAPDIDNHDLLPIGADRHDSSDEARQAHLQGISSYLMSEHDEGARQRVTDTLGRVPDVADTKSRNYWAGRAYAKANGFYGNPENYWRAQNMKLPYAEKKGDMYELIGAELAQKTHTHHLQLKQQEKEYEAFEARNADTLSKLLAGHDYEEFYGEGGGISRIDMQQLAEQMDSSIMDQVNALPWKQKAPMSRNPLLDMTAEATGINMQKVLRINAVMKQVRKAAELTEDGDFEAHGALRRVSDKIGTLVANIAEIDKDGNYHIPEEDLAYIHRGLMTIAEEIKERDVVDSLDNFNLAFMSTFDDIAAFLVNFEASSGNDRISQEALDAQEAAHLKSWQLFEYGENNPAFIDGHVIRTPDEYVQRYMQRFYDQNARVTRNELARKQHTAIRQLQGAFQAYAQVAASSADHLAWYKKVTKGAAAMAGDSALYLLPIVGQSVGTAGAIASGYERNMNSNYFEGLRGSEALVRSWQDDNIQALVELLPWSRVGGAGLNKWAGKMLNKGKVGTLTRSIAKFSSRGGLRAYALEVGGMFIDEGLIEPLSGGILTLTSDAALDALGIAHGESRSFSEAFEDITELYEDPAQAGALGLFSAVLNGARLPALLSQSRHFATLSDTWERVGLSKAQAQRVIESENPLDAGQKLWQEEMAKDPTAVRERMRKKSKQQPEEGSILLATGQMQGAEGDANRIRQETWREMQQRGFVPQVEALGERDGEEHFRITELSPNGEQVLATHEFNAKKADDYLAARITMAEQRHFAGQQNVIYGAMSDHASQIVGEAMAQAAENTKGKKGITIENLNELPEGIGEQVQRDGMLTIKSIKLAAEKLGGKWKSVFSSFAERQSIAEQQGASATGSAVLRMREASPYNTRGIHGSTIHVARGSARAHEVLEDTIESFADMDLQERALRLTDEQSLTPEEAMKAAFSEQVAMVRATRDSLMRIDSSLKLPELPEDASYMQLIETLSQMGVSQMLTTGLLPKELDGITDMIKGAVDLSAQSVKLARAWKKAKDQGLDGLPEMSDYFEQLGMDVRDTFSRARIDERVLEAVRKSRPIIQGQQQLMGVDVPTVEQIREEQAAAQARDDEEEAFEDKHRIEASPQQVQASHASDVEQHITHTSSRASSAVHGVFVDNAAAYNKAGGYWMGCIPVKHLSDSKDVQQVKAGAKGKHGVINPITGDYQQDTEAIYVWKRKDGRLEVISGRHKYDLALRTDTEAVTCYVYLESSKHDAKWARLLDFENNMRGDQADELTAAIYTRETGYTDQQLQRKGLMRNKSKSKRGILIGREAREELWTRFKNGAISPIDAEIIVQMTKNLRNAERIEDIQAKCVHLLDQKKSWDYISAMVQLMASKESVFMKQGLLDLGADFEADMEKAAAYIEKSVQGLNEAITIIKQGKKLSGKKKQLAARLGLSTTSQTETEQKLDDLTLMKEMFAAVGSYPELIAAAQMWDGKTELDPVGYALTYATKARERANAEKELSREDWEQSQVDYSGMGELSFSTRRKLDELGLKPSDVVRPQRHASTRDEARGILLGVRDTMFRIREGSKRASDLVPIRGKGIIAPGVDFEVFVTGKTADKTSSGKALAKSITSKEIHYLAAANIDLLWMKSFPLDIEQSRNGATDIKEVHKRTAYFEQEGKIYKVKITAKRFKTQSQTDNLYSIEITDVIELKEPDGSLVDRSNETASPHTPHQAQGDDSTLSPDVKPTSSTDVNFTASVRNLVSAHTIDLSRLKDAAKLGGMPLPSIAVTRTDKPYAWGSPSSSLTLIAGSELADPEQGNDVYTADAYTGVFPSVVNKKSAQAQDIMDKIQTLAKQATKYNLDSEASIVDDIRRVLDNHPIKSELISNGLHYSNAFYLLFAAKTKHKPQLAEVDIHVLRWEDAELRTASENFADVLNSTSSSSEEKHNEIDKFALLLEASIEKVPSDLAFRGVTILAIKRMIASIRDEKTGLNGAMALAGEIAEARRKGYKKPEMLSLTHMKEHADANPKKFDKFKQEIAEYYSDELILEESGEAMTLDTVTRHMKYNKNRGNEKGALGMNNGQVFAARAQKIITLSELKEQRDKLVSTVEHSERKTEAVSKMEAFGEALAAVVHEDYFSARDTANKILAEAPSANRASIANAMKGAHLSWKKGAKKAQLEILGAEAVEAIDALPMDYFESVPQRAVKLNEWKFALASTELKADRALTRILRENNIKPIWHDGTQEGRAEAMASLQKTRVTFSMRTFNESAMAARAVFAERADEKESVQLLKRYDLLIDTLQESLAAGNRDETLGTGAQRYAAIISLLEATKGVLPEKYTHMGKLNGLLKWAAVYAQMIETGEIPRTGSGVLKGHIAEKFVQSMKNKKNDMLLQGLSESEAREAMATLAAERIETSLLKVANAARARVDMFIKDRAWERVELTAERAYPKKEKGRKSPRGKLDSAGYKQMEYALSVMRMDSNAIAEEMAGLRGRIAELIPDSEDYAARKDELEEQLNQVAVFGCWSRMSAPQAQSAAEAFVALVMQRKTLWEQQLEKRVLHRHYVMNQLKARFKVDNNANNRSEGKRSYNPLKTLKRVGKETGYGLMNYNQLLLSSKHVFGEQFTRERIQDMVDATQSLNIANTENETFFAQSVSEATGIDLSEENALIDWLNDFGKVQNTGIKKQEFITYTIKLPIDEARAWVALSKEERAAKREKLTKDATEQELATRNIPSERDIWMMEQDLKEHDLKAAEGKSMSKRKWVEVRGRHKSGNTVELIASKDAVANALLLFEQEDYEHLIEHEGFVPIDAQGNIIDRSTDRETPIDPQRTLQPLYDYVGVEALSLAHKLRRKVSENFEGVAKKYAEERGINIAQKPKYWRGNFNLNIMLEKDTLTQLNASAGAGYGFLIDRVKHHSAIEWTNTMSAVFLRSIKDQNNYLYTSHITNDWRAMLMDTSFSRGIELELGKEYLDTLKSWINIIDGASMADELANKWTQNILGAMMRGVANAALSGNGWVLAKQSSAILHGMLGGEVPRDVIEGREGIRELEYRHIGMGEFAAAMARSKAGQSKISLKEIGESKAFLARLDSKYKRIAQRMTLKDGQRQHRYMMRYTDASMDAIDYVDRKFNVLSMHALADAIYHNLEKQKKEKNINWTHEEMVQAALDSVGRAISLSAQPKRIIDKSLFAARGGLITNIMLMFKSEIINKLGLTISRMMSGEIYSATSLHLLYGISTAFIATAIGWIRYGDSDDDEDKALWKEALSFGVKIGTGDLSATPIIGDGIKSITSRLTGEWNSARPLHEMFIDPIGIYQKSARLISGKKQGRDMTAHDYLSTTQGLIRAFGAASGIFLNNKGGSTAATILDLATASNQARTLSDFIKKLHELTE